MIKIVEDNLQRLFQEKTFLQVSSMQINTILWWQKKLKDVAGNNHLLDELTSEVHKLEKKCFGYEEAIEKLQEEVKALKVTKPTKVSRKPKIRKTAQTDLSH